MSAPESDSQKEQQNQANVPASTHPSAAQAATGPPLQTEQKIEERMSAFEKTADLLTKFGIFAGVLARFVFGGQLWGMYEAALRKSSRPASAEIETRPSCPNCKSGSTEIYETSREGQGWICRDCHDSWIVPSDRRGVPSVIHQWSYVHTTSCPGCGSTEFEMRTYGGSWDDADTHCARCGRLIQPAWTM
jgi:transposase-like protein